MNDYEEGIFIINNLHKIRGDKMYTPAEEKRLNRLNSRKRIDRERYTNKDEINYN